MGGKITKQELNNNLIQEIESKVKQSEFDEHKADYVQLKGDLSTLQTTAKDNIPNIVNELFTNVSNGKDLVSRAITGVDGGVVIPANPTFSDLGSAIGRVSTGTKWFQLTTKTSGPQIDFTREDGSIQGSVFIDINTSLIGFKPRIIIARIYNISGVSSSATATWYADTITLSPSIYFNCDNGAGYRYRIPYNANSIKLPVYSNRDFTVVWFAYQ